VRRALGGLRGRNERGLKISLVSPTRLLEKVEFSFAVNFVSSAIIAIFSGAHSTVPKSGIQAA